MNLIPCSENGHFLSKGTLFCKHKTPLAHFVAAQVTSSGMGGQGFRWNMAVVSKLDVVMIIYFFI